MAYRLPTSQYGSTALEGIRSIEVGGCSVSQRRCFVGLENPLLQSASKIGVDWVRYVFVLPVSRLPAWHRYKDAALAFDEGFPEFFNGVSYRRYNAEAG